MSTHVKPRVSEAAVAGLLPDGTAAVGGVVSPAPGSGILMAKTLWSEVAGLCSQAFREIEEKSN